MPSGYSGKPLWQKLGIKPGSTVNTIGAPTEYEALLGGVPPKVKLAGPPHKGADFVHFFATQRAVLSRNLVSLRREMAVDGVLWVSWPKRTAGVPTNVTEDVIREVALPLGWVDVKVCAVDETWSGLKLVLRRALR